jgi:26S proteasome regulatory subunit N12
MADALLTSFKGSIASSDFDSALSQLSQLKITMTGMTSLPPCNAPSASAAQELAFATEVLENAAILHIKREDMDAFERQVAQLRPYYSGGASAASASELRNSILGLTLMNLLVDNRLAEFHSELELISGESRTSPHVVFPMQLEQWLMEGSYAKVIQAKKTCPPQSQCFMEGLVMRVRDDIASCFEASYKTVSLKEAQSMLLFGSVDELKEYIQDNQEAWEVTDSDIVFKQAKETVDSEDIPSMRLIHEALSYAIELDRIV